MIKLPPDITFVIQIVSFLVFWLLMKRLLFTPVEHVLQARAARTLGERERAEAMRAEAAALTTEIDAALAEARLDGMSRAEEIRRQGELEERSVLERSRNEAAVLLSRERAITSAQVEAARAPLAADAERLADAVVVKVLGRAA
jgi:F-type H+-transporting ATPase subunit b